MDSNNITPMMPEPVEAEIVAFNNSLEQAAITARSIVNLTDNVGELVRTVSETMVQMKTIDAQFKVMLAKIDSDLERFRALVGLTEKQLTLQLEIIGESTRAIMGMHRPDMTEMDLRAMNSCLQALQMQNATYNNMVMALFSK